MHEEEPLRMDAVPSDKRENQPATRVILGESLEPPTRPHSPLATRQRQKVRAHVVHTHYGAVGNDFKERERRTMSLVGH